MVTNVVANQARMPWLVHLSRSSAIGFVPKIDRSSALACLSSAVRCRWPLGACDQCDALILVVLTRYTTDKDFWPLVVAENAPISSTFSKKAGKRRKGQLARERFSVTQTHVPRFLF